MHCFGLLTLLNECGLDRNSWSTVGAPYLAASSAPMYFEIELGRMSGLSGLSGRVLAGYAGTNFQDARARASAFEEGLGFDSISWSVDSSDGSGVYRLVNLPFALCQPNLS